MVNVDNLAGRVMALEASMEWAHGSVQKIDRDMEILKQNHFLIMERFATLQFHIDERLVAIQDKLMEFQAHNDERFSAVNNKLMEFQVHNDERFSAVNDKLMEFQVHNDRRITELHQAISSQTRWLLIAIFSAATMISIVLPIATAITQSKM